MPPKPIITSAWCMYQPCYEFFGLTINQMSSSILVYVLGLYGLFVGYKFYKNRQEHQARLYWSYSLIIGGIGALSAGTSFQAFGYEIKCEGKEFCDLTSIYELVNNLCMIWAAGFMFLAICAAFLQKFRLKTLGFGVLIYGLSYTLLCLWAYSRLNYFLLSFEFQLLFTIPVYLGIFILTLWQYTQHQDKNIGYYAKAWIILSITPLAYYIYLTNGYTEILWNKGFWFSANDVLHIGMLMWLIYLSNYLLFAVEDKRR